MVLSKVINGDNIQSKNTLKMAAKYRLNQEIKFLHLKKSKLNEQLYLTHLECAEKWKKHYDRLNKKIDRLSETHHQYNNRRNKTRIHHFHPRIANLTNINFPREETALLEKGLQHIIKKPINKYWTNLLIETEEAIKTLDTNKQEAMRLLASTKLRQIKTSSTSLNPMAKRQTYLTNKINETLAKEHAILTKADKGRTIVIIYTKDYKDNVNHFLKNNNFHMIPKNPSNRFQQQLNKTIHKCNLIIWQNQIKYLTQKKPQHPTLNAQIKLHKPDKPIRPVINNKLAPTYKIAKFLSKQLNNYINLKNSYIV
jgi:predicted CoA-binding protein